MFPHVNARKLKFLVVIIGHVCGVAQTVAQMYEIRSIGADSKNGDFGSSSKKE